MVGFFQIIILLIVGLAFTAGPLIKIYNTLVPKRNTVKNAWAQVSVQLKRRADLLPNYANTVKAYATHENKTFTEVTEARGKAVNAKTPEEKIKAESILESALSKLLALVEAYPTLKANENFLELQRQLAGIEIDIAEGRASYNEAVLDYNNTIQVFPTLIFAMVFHFKAFPFFEVKEENAPAIFI